MPFITLIISLALIIVAVFSVFIMNMDSKTANENAAISTVVEVAMSGDAAESLLGQLGSNADEVKVKVGADVIYHEGDLSACVYPPFFLYF